MILFAATGMSERETAEYVGALRGTLPVAVHGTDPYEPAAIAYAVTWRPQPGLLAGLPNLAAIFNLGAGVDALLADPSLPDVPLVRFVDHDLTIRMGEWVTLQVLTHHRRALPYLAQQRAATWNELPTPAANEVRVGILGFGTLGAHCGRVLSALGFAVHGHALTARQAAVPLSVGPSALPDFLAGTDILVVLLPLTAATRGILDARLLAQLPQTAHGPVLVNAGRGGLQVEADLVAALEDGTLKGASLDVFQTEPLPADSPLWALPNVVVTPHVASVTSPAAVARNVAAGIAAHRRGEPLRHVVVRWRGY